MKEAKRMEKDVVIREEDGVLVMEVKMSESLRKEMAMLAEKTAGTIPAIKNPC